MMREAWMKHGKCHGLDPGLWVLDDLLPRDEHKAAEMWAKDFCKGLDGRGRCQVISNCLQYAIQTRQIGIWGGCNDSERKKIRRNELKVAI